MEDKDKKKNVKKIIVYAVLLVLIIVTEDTYNKATDYIQANALRLNYRPAASTIDAEFPDDIDPAKAPELADAVIREVHQTL